MNFGYLASSGALVLGLEEVDVAADGTKHILWVFECVFDVGVVAGNQYEVGDRFDELKVVEMLCKMWGKDCKPDLHHVLVLGTSPLFHLGNFSSKVVYVKQERNYGKSFNDQVQTLLLAVNIFQKTNNPFPGVIFK